MGQWYVQYIVLSRSLEIESALKSINPVKKLTLVMLKINQQFIPTWLQIAPMQSLWKKRNFYWFDFKRLQYIFWRRKNCIGAITNCFNVNSERIRIADLAPKWPKNDMFLYSNQDLNFQFRGGLNWKEKKNPNKVFS